MTTTEPRRRSARRAATDPFVAAMTAAAGNRFVLRAPEVLRTLDISPGMLYRRLHLIGWQPEQTGVWVPPGAPHDPLRHLIAVTAAVGDRALVTGRAALWLRGVWSQPPARPALLVRLHDRVRPQGARVIATTTYDRVRSARIENLWVAATARAIADFATEGATVAQLVFAVVTAVRLRRCTLDDIRLELGARRRFPGRARLRQALAMLEKELSHSGVERLARRRLRQLDGGFSAAPHEVWQKGRRIAEVDIAQAALRYGVEVDGPVHLWPEQRTHDEQRDRDLGRSGWVIDRYWWYEIEADLERVVGEVAQRLAELRAGQRPGGG